MPGTNCPVWAEAPRVASTGMFTAQSSHGDPAVEGYCLNCGRHQQIMVRSAAFDRQPLDDVVKQADNVIADGHHRDTLDSLLQSQLQFGPTIHERKQVAILSGERGIDARAQQRSRTSQPL